MMVRWEIYYLVDFMLSVQKRHFFNDSIFVRRTLVLLEYFGFGKSKFFFSFE